jgi:GWxTD domain-containing protein
MATINSVAVVGSLFAILTTQPCRAQTNSHVERQRRIEYANQNFATRSTRGSQTVRGKLYVAFGPPAKIEVHDGTDQPDTQTEIVDPYPWQVWRYRTIPGIGKDVQIILVDTRMNGTYVMLPPEVTGDPEKDAEAKRQYRLIRERSRIHH